MHDFLLDLGTTARGCCLDSLNSVPREERSRVQYHAGSDVIYQIDQDVERALVHRLETQAAVHGGIVMVAEGIGENETSIFPKHLPPEDAKWRLLVDPIDGTRGIMMDKRSAWFLAGAAPNRGANTCLSDITHAVMVELPTTRARVGDVFWAQRGQGVGGYTEHLETGTRVDRQPQPSIASSWRGGFGQISRFFPPGRDQLALLEEELLQTLYPDAAPGEILSFEDQYISSGGQLYELLTGKDRFTADLRATLYASERWKDSRPGHVCHPYDLAAHLIGEEAGLRLCNPDGTALDAAFDTRSPADWIGYGNGSLQNEIAPVLHELLLRKGWLPSLNSPGH